MQDQKMLHHEKASSSKSKKKTSAKQKSLDIQSHNMKRVLDSKSPPLQISQKASKRSSQDEASPLSQHPERSYTDPFLESSTSEDKYRALRRKYLLLEEETFKLGNELKEAEDDIMALQEEKLTLLDKLVVLEGLVDPSDTPS